MDFFLPSDIARLVLGYLKENKFHKTHSCFLKECPHLQEYYNIMMEGRELQTTILGFSLIMILEEWGKLKQGNSVQQKQPCRKTSTSPAASRRSTVSSPLKQALSTSPYRSQHVKFSEKSSESSSKILDQQISQKDQGYPLLKGLLDTISKKASSTVHILPLTPEKHPPKPSSINYSPQKEKTEQSEKCKEKDSTEVSKSSDTEDAAEHEPPSSDVIDVGASSESKDETNNNTKEPTKHMLKTPNKAAAKSSTPTLTAQLVTPVKLFQAENNTSTTRSPRRKKPKTPRKRTSDIGSHSGSEEVPDVPEPVFKKILEDNKLHEKLAETCNTVLENMNHSGSKERKLSGHVVQEKRHSGQGLENQEDVDVVTGSRSLEEILDMDTNFATDFVSENIDMSDPVYESLFKLFGKDKEVFYDELRKEKNKTDEMAKEVEELEKSIQQDIANAASEYNSPIHSVEMALNSPDIMHRDPDSGQPSMLINPTSTICTQPSTSCPDNNPGGFPPSLRDTEFGSPIHSTPSHQQNNAVSSPSSVVTQPFSPVEYSQILSPCTPHSCHPPTPSHTAVQDNLADADTLQNNPCSSGFMSPNSNGPISPHAIGNGGTHMQHQSTPVSNRHQKGYVEQTMANCSPLVKSDLNCASPIMVQKPSVFTPRSTYTPQSRKCIFTPQGTNRPLFSPPFQGQPACPISTIQAAMPGPIDPQIGGVLPQNDIASTVHNESFGYQMDVGAPTVTSSSYVFSGSNPCSTIANSIDCISLPPEPEQSTNTRKSRRTTKPGGKKKGNSKSTENGIEMGSSTFTTLKNLLSKPSTDDTGADSQQLSNLDLLSQEMMQLSSVSGQNRIIVLTPDGKHKMEIPVLDCHDELGLASSAADIGEAETISMWESDLNTSTQYSILPENQITQSIVNSIEQGQAPDMSGQVQKKRSSEKSKRKQSKNKEPKPRGRKKKEKNTKKSGYFQSSSEKKVDSKEADEMYIASPLVWTDKTFVRNLDFGVDENKFRKILPKPSMNENSAGTVLILNDNPIVAETLSGAGVAQILTVDSQEPELTAVKIHMPESHDGIHVVYESSGVQDIDYQESSQTSECVTVDGDVTLHNSDDIETIDQANKYVEGESMKIDTVDKLADGDLTDTTCVDDKQSLSSAQVVSVNNKAESSVLEPYKDWKGCMKIDKQKPSSDIRTSTPLYETVTVAKGNGHKFSAAQETTDHLNTIKKNNKIILKENAIKKLFKKSAHRISHVKAETPLGLRNIENKSAFRTPRNSYVKVPTIGRENKNKSPKSDSSVEEISEEVLNSSSEKSVSSPTNINSKCGKKSNFVSSKKQKSSTEKNSPSDSSKSRGKTKSKGKNLLKVKLPSSKGKLSKNKPKHKRSSTEGILEIEEESSDEDIPLVQLQNKMHTKSPVKSPSNLSLRPPTKLTWKSPTKAPAISYTSSEKSPSKSSESLKKSSKSPIKSSVSTIKSVKSPIKSVKSPTKFSISPIKSPVQTPVKSVPSTPQKPQADLSNEMLTPSKETLLEKVGLTPTKTIMDNEFKSPGRANPLDVLAEWQGSPRGRKKRHSGPVTRNNLNHLNGGFKSPSRKAPSTVNRRTPGRNLLTNFSMSETNKLTEKVSNTEVKESAEKEVKSRNSHPKKSRGKKLFNEKPVNKKEKCDSKTGKQTQETKSLETSEVLNNENTNIKDTDKEIETNIEDTTEINNVTEDELQLALQSIQMDTGDIRSECTLQDYSDQHQENTGNRHNVISDQVSLSEDLNINSEDHTKSAKNISNGNIETNSMDLDIRNKYDSNNKENRIDTRKSSCREESHNVDKLAESEHETVENNIHKNDKRKSGNSDLEIINEKRKEHSEANCSQSDKPESSDGTITYVPNMTNTNSIQCDDYENVKENHTNDYMQNVSDTGIEMSNHEENKDPLDEKARRKERKRRHREQRRIRKSLEAARLSQSSGIDTNVELGQNHGGETSTNNESVEESGSHHHHRHHKHKHHHHHGKHKKKKSKKRHRDEDDTEHKEMHKSKKRRLEASRALEMVDIDEALSELYSSPIAAT